MRFLIIFIFLLSNSFADETTNIKNLIINKELKKYDGLTFLDAKNKQLNLSDFKRQVRFYIISLFLKDIRYSILANSFIRCEIWYERMCSQDSLTSCDNLELVQKQNHMF